MNANAREPTDLETYAQERRKPPEHGPYRIKINGGLHVVEGPTITVLEIIVLAGKRPPDQYLVFRRVHGHQEPNPLPPNAVIDLREPGIERFLVLPKVQPDGLDAPRRQFQLPARDVKTLEALELSWETVIGGGVCRLLIFSFPLPEGYTVLQVDLSIRIEAGYPDTALDMACFCPPVQRKDGRSVSMTSSEQFDGRTWQRWSRHRGESDVWMQGVDDLATHLACVRVWLLAEFSR